MQLRFKQQKTRFLEELKMTEQEPIKIVIPVEEEDPPLKVDASKTGAKTAAYDASRKIAGLAKDAAQRAAQVLV